MRSRRFLALLSAAVCLVILSGCGGGAKRSEAMGGGLAVTFTPSGSSAAADRVRLVAGTAVGGEIPVDVAITGPTSSTNLHGFAFDLVLGDTSVIEYVPQSAVVGSALNPGGCPGVTTLVSQTGNRVVVGISKLSNCPGNGVLATDDPILTLRFRALAAGSSSVVIAGAPGGQPVAQDPTGATISSVTFDGAAASISAN